MKWTSKFAAIYATAVTLVAASQVQAQVTHRRPMAPTPAVNYGFDNNAGAGCRDYNCGSRCYDGHSGTDFGVPVGTTVMASAEGVVVATNNSCANTGYVGNPCGGRCGNYVQLQHSDGSRTIYCHMGLNTLAVARGQRVHCGQTLGRSASSGSSSGPHLHFGFKRSAVAASIDSYRGRCTTSAGVWTDQNPYPASPGDQCDCVPSPETCNNRDDDCDGRIDDGVRRNCYDGPAGSAGRGICSGGTETCTAGRWGNCVGQVVPRAETCNRMDDDCDGRVDDNVCIMDAGTVRDAATSDRPTPVMDIPDQVTDAPTDNDSGTAERDAGEGDDAEFEDVDPEMDDQDLSPDRMDPGCGCRISGQTDPPKRNEWIVLLVAATAVLRRTTRTRHAV